MDDTNNKWQAVVKENELLQAALPDLLKTLSGRWVVFKHGKVQSDYATEEEAYKAALAAYGLEGGFVVAVIEAPKGPRYISAMAAFGL
jgi:hypothetical protein